MEDPAIQDGYPDVFNRCYGCGQLNEHGHKVRSHWSGDDVVASFVPRPYHLASPGFVYGGLIASIMDCHAIGTAIAYAYRAEGREMGSLPIPAYVTGSLRVDYLRPTPLGPTLVLKARTREMGARKTVVGVELSADGVVTARGEVVAVRMPETMLAGGETGATP